MKSFFIFVMCLVLGVSTASAQGEPSWVNTLPKVRNAYIGIASAPLTDSDYRNTARLSALNDIASQLCTRVESDSFIKTVDVDGDAREVFEQNIKESLSSHISGHELVDSYQSSTHYYVYYKLDKSDYSRFIKNKEKEVVQKALDLLAKGKDIEIQGDLITAISFYTSGLESLEPYLYLSLSGMYNGRYINVANELYTAYKSIFTGMSLMSNVSVLDVEPFKTLKEPVAVCLSKDGLVIPNVDITARFVSGDGEITPTVKTDVNGTAVFYVTNVSSKDDVQTVNISIDDSFLEKLPMAYRSIINVNAMPVVTVTLNAVSPIRIAYFDIEDNEIPQCEKLVRSIFANNYFELTGGDDADFYIAYSTELELGKDIEGDLYALKECFCSMNIKIYNNKTENLLGEYNISQCKVLVPVSKSEEQRRAMCTRELMKRFKVGLPKVINKIKL